MSILTARGNGRMERQRCCDAKGYRTCTDGCCKENGLFFAAA